MNVFAEAIREFIEIDEGRALVHEVLAAGEESMT